LKIGDLVQISLIELNGLLLQIQSTTVGIRKILVSVCNTVCQRGAGLAAAGIVGILKKIGRDGSVANGSIKRNNMFEQGEIYGYYDELLVNYISDGKTIVAMDGGLYEHYIEFRNYMQGHRVSGRRI
jgi:hexokinase